MIDEAQTVKAGQESARFHTHGGRDLAMRVLREEPGRRIAVKERKHSRPEIARRDAHAAVAAIKSGIDRGELEDVVAEPPAEHVDLLGTGPVVHS